MIHYITLHYTVLCYIRIMRHATTHVADRFEPFAQCTRTAPRNNINNNNNNDNKDMIISIDNNNNNYY